MNERTIIVTGGAGFIGSNFVRLMVSKGWLVITLDALTYAGNQLNLSDLAENPNHKFVHGSIADRDLVDTLLTEHAPSAIVNFAAESHVDRSIDGPADFIETNIVGIFVLLESIRDYLGASGGVTEGSAFRFLHISTDEVYGSIATGEFTESSPYSPNSPYAASKASADHLVRAWHKTYGLPSIITNCSNNYGPYQFPEKLIPLMIIKALQGEHLPVYGDGRQVRDWIYVEDHCRALATVLDRGVVGETYIVGSETPRQNLDIVIRLCGILDRLRPRADGGSYKDLIEHVKDRPGHDARYAVDSSKLRRDLAWRAEFELDAGLEQTVKWYLENNDWISAVRLRYDGARLGSRK